MQHQHKARPKILVTLILAFCLYLLGQWNLDIHGMFLEFCSSGSSIEATVCGDARGAFGKGELYDSAADIFLVPTRLIYPLLSTNKSIFVVSDFQLDFLILHNTYFVSDSARNIYTMIHLAVETLQLLYCFLFARLIQWAWQNKDSFNDSTPAIVCASMGILFLYWSIPFGGILFPLVFGTISISVIMVLFKVLKKIFTKRIK